MLQSTGSSDDVTKLRDKISQLNEKISELQTEMKSKESQKEQQIDRFLIDRENITKEAAATLQKLRSAEEKLGALQQQHAKEKQQLEQTVQTLTQQLVQAQHSVEQQKNLIQTLTQENRALIGKSPSSSSHQGNNELSNLKELLQTKVKMIDQLEKELTESKKNEAHCRNEMLQQKQKNDEMQKEMASYKNGKTAIVSESPAQHEDQMNREENQTANKEEQSNHPLQQTAAAIQQQQAHSEENSSLKDYRQTIERLTEELESIQNRLKITQEDFEAEKRILQQHIDMQQKRLNEAELEQIRKDRLLASFNSGSLKALKNPNEEIKRLNEKILALQERNSFLISEVCFYFCFVFLIFLFFS